MKRKVKLFTAIVALMLSIGLMAFGVYAASTITYNISGSVDYDITDVLVSIQTSLKYVVDDASTEDVKENKIGYNSSSAKSATYNGTDLSGLSTTLTGDTSIQTYDASNVVNSVTDGTATLSVSFNDSTAWEIDITITNIQRSNGVDIEIGDFEIPEGANYNLVAKDDNASSIEPNTTITLTYYLYLIDTTTTITNQTFSIPVTLTQSEN